MLQMIQNIGLPPALQKLQSLLAPAGLLGPLLTVCGILLLLLRSVFDAAAQTARAKKEYEDLQKSGILTAVKKDTQSAKAAAKKNAKDNAKKKEAAAGEEKTAAPNDAKTGAEKAGARNDAKAGASGGMPHKAPQNAAQNAPEKAIRTEAFAMPQKSGKAPEYASLPHTAEDAPTEPLADSKTPDDMQAEIPASAQAEEDAAADIFARPRAEEDTAATPPAGTAVLPAKAQSLFGAAAPGPRRDMQTSSLRPQKNRKKPCPDPDLYDTSPLRPEN